MASLPAFNLMKSVGRTEEEDVTGISPPNNLRAVAGSTGAVALGWSYSGGQRAFFSVWRKLSGNPSFEQIGLSALESFLDSSFPAHETYAEYQVRAHDRFLASEPCAPASVSAESSLAAA